MTDSTGFRPARAVAGSLCVCPAVNSSVDYTLPKEEEILSEKKIVAYRYFLQPGILIQKDKQQQTTTTIIIILKNKNKKL